MTRLSERARARRGLLVRLGLFLLVTGSLTVFIAAQIASADAFDFGAVAI